MVGRTDRHSFSLREVRTTPLESFDVEAGVIKTVRPHGHRHFDSNADIMGLEFAGVSGLKSLSLPVKAILDDTTLELNGEMGRDGRGRDVI